MSSTNPAIRSCFGTLSSNATRSSFSACDCGIRTYRAVRFSSFIASYQDSTAGRRREPQAPEGDGEEALPELLPVDGGRASSPEPTGYVEQDMPPLDTGFPTSDAQDDFSRARRRAVLSRIAHRLRGQPSDVGLILPFEEVVDALGRVSERSIGLQSIPLDSIVGTVGRARDFDRSFRPTSNRSRPRWEQIANAQRRGKDMPPISVYRIGDMHFVRDGHHRVSVARAQGRDTIDAYVTEVKTRIGADRAIRMADLPLKDHLRMFLERVPLTDEELAEMRLSDPWAYACLAEAIEAWGFRLSQNSAEFLSREDVAKLWLDEEFRPVVRMLEETDLIGWGTPADAYMRVADDRYRLMRTHEWNDAVIERL